MKQKLIRAVCLMLLAALLVTPVLAATSVSVSLKASDSTVNSGDQVTVTVSAKVNSCGSGGIEISYDSKVFELVSGEWLLSNTMLTDFSSSSKDGVFAFGDNSAIDGKVFKLVLKVKSSASLGSSKVTVKFTADGVTASKSTSITVACAHKYDNSCDTSCNLCGDKRSITHSWDSGKVTKKATCTAKGTKTYTCTVCKETKTEDIDKASHSWDSGKETKKATCTAKGTKTYTCTACGTTKTEDIAKKSHSYDNACDTSCNSCGATRETKHDYQLKSDEASHWEECSACGDKKDSEAHAPAEELSSDTTGHGHACTVCGYVADREDHSFEHECDTACDICGYERTVTHDYSTIWASNESGHWHECTICGDKLELVLHNPGPEATETSDQICLDCGYILQVAGNHQHSMAGDWLSNDVGHWFLCLCNVYTEPEAHAWDDGTIDEAAGTITYHCGICGHQLTEAYTPPSEPEPQPTEPEKPTDPTVDDNPGIEAPFGDFPWWIAAIGLAVLLVISIGFNIYLLVCLFASKKTGKFVRKDDDEEIVEE